jgi:hypothetical protein
MAAMTSPHRWKRPGNGNANHILSRQSRESGAQYPGAPTFFYEALQYWTPDQVGRRRLLPRRDNKTVKTIQDIKRPCSGLGW